jgi:hypothetical protein
MSKVVEESNVVGNWPTGTIETAKGLSLPLSKNSTLILSCALRDQNTTPMVTATNSRANKIRSDVFVSDRIDSI